METLEHTQKRADGENNLRLHVAKDAFGKGDEIGPVRRFALAESCRAVLFPRAGYQPVGEVWGAAALGLLLPLVVVPFHAARLL